MNKVKFFIILTFSFLGVFLIDQTIKQLFVDGFRWYGECIDFILVYNKGVAFSMFSFLSGSLKYIQIVLLVGVFLYIIYQNDICLSFPAGLVLGAGSSNIYDRFIHGGVVDMVYWHCGFDFAIFNFADVMIDISLVLFLIIYYKPSLFCQKNIQN